ncbi:MAG: TetR/AcrR family transcriptional regulator, ethionamide resistance regulator, partial [Solirubrobacteraceae bacterium]|nr:TetR/AcrR family transcriptional regulator, ethionamide resistance regulator [Solirubrobacteraceae bacterium]
IAPDDISPKLCAQALLAMVENHIVRELVLGHGDATESIRALAELWWRAAYSRPDDVAAAVAEASDAAAASLATSAAPGPAAAST